MKRRGPLPYACADCSFLPDDLEADPRPCPRCGGTTYRLGSMIVTVTGRRIAVTGSTPGRLAKQALAGQTLSDRQLMRRLGIGWEASDVS